MKGRRRKEGGERKKGGGKKGGGKKGGGKKGGGSGCCNTATYSTGEGGAMMERERGERGGWREGKEAKGRRRKEAGSVEKGGGGGCCNTATYSTGEGGATMERERGEIIIQIIMLL